MATEQPKPAATQEHPFPPIAPYPHQHFNAGTYPPPGPPGTYPPYFAYPPSSDGNHGDSNGQNGAPPGPPYMMPYPPPGMVYAYPPQHGQGFAIPPGTSVPQAVTRAKRKQVKMACTNCAAACKRCDEGRPCERCLKYGVAESCVDGQRKERKKGVKRGPYKRKNKPNSSDDAPSFGENQPTRPEGEWQAGTQPPPAASTTTAAIHAVTQYATPEGYYPVYYPPPGTFMPAVHEGPPGQEGSTPHGNAQPPIVPYYIHPGGYPPYPYAHPGSAYPPHGGPPPPSHTLDPAEPAKKPDEAAGSGGTGGVRVDLVPAKRTVRSPKAGESKAKKTKITGNRWQKAVKPQGEATHEPDQEYVEPVAATA